MADLDFKSLIEQLPEPAGTTDEGTMAESPEPLVTSDLLQSVQGLMEQQRQTGVNAPTTTFFDPTEREKSFQEMYGEKNLLGEVIPIDFGSGLPAMEYVRVAEQSSPQKKYEVLKQQYPDKVVRLLPTGDITIRLSEGLKPTRDVVINPQGLDTNDWIDLAVQAPEVAAAMFFALPQGKITQAAGMAMRIAKSALALGVTGAARDITAQGTAGLDIDFEEIGKRRALEGAAQGAMDVASVGASKVMRVFSPFAGQKSGFRLRQMEAMEKVKQESGGAFDFGPTLTPAQVTDSKILQNAESFEKKQPGASIMFAKRFDAQREILRGLQERALGGPPKAIDVEQTGQMVIDALRDVTDATEAAVEKAREIAVTKGNKDVLATLDGLLGKGPVAVREAGETIRASRAAAFASAKSHVDALYDEVRQAAGGTGDVLDWTTAKKMADAIESEFPKVVKEVDVVEESASGFPLTKTSKVVGTETKKIPLTEGIPPGLMAALGQLRTIQGGKVSLDTLKTMKNAAYDEILKTQAVPDLKDRWWNKVAKAYEEGIEEAVANVDPSLPGAADLKAKLVAAKEGYKKYELPFEVQGVSDIPRRPTEGGYKSPEELVTRLTSGGKAVDYWRALKGILPAGDPAIGQVKRAVIDDALETAKDPLLNTINTKNLEGQLLALKKGNKELFEDIFGGKDNDLLLQLRSINMAETGVNRARELNPREARLLLSSVNPNFKDLSALALAEAKRTTLYANELFSRVSQGLPIATGIKTTELVDYAMSHNFPMNQLQAVVSTLTTEAPAARDALATAALFKFFKAASSEQRGIISMSAKKLAEATGLENEANWERFALLMGDKTVLGKMTRTDMTKALYDILKPEELAAEQFESSGSLATSMTISKFLGQPRQFAEDAGSMFAKAYLYTHPAVLKMVANQKVTPERAAAAANMMIASMPFLQAAWETVGPEATAVLVDNVKERIDKTLYEARIMGTRLMAGPGAEPLPEP